MNKSDLIARVAKEAKANGVDVTQTGVAIIIDSVFTTITERLYQEDAVNIADFGKFSTVKRPERMGRNPATGESITIPAKNAVHFKPAKTLKEYIQD